MVKDDKLHVLLVEDDTFLANIYKTKFELEGFKVSVAENGELGLKEAKKKKPDLILLDILLPKMDGFTVLGHLKEDRDLQSIPVILLTNLGQKDDVEKGLELGAVDYLIKAHFKPSETVEKVRKVLEKRRQGFTLIELLVVIAIIGFLSVIAVIALGAARESARDAIRLADLRELQNRLELYYVDHQAYPAVPEPRILGSGDAACLNPDGFAPAGCVNAYMDIIHADPGKYHYAYRSEDGTRYMITAELEGEVNGLSGQIVVTPSEIYNAQ